MADREANLLKCEVCGSLVRRDQINGICSACGRRTCANCQRICDRCLRVFCMFDIEAREVWRQGVMQRLRLCDICKSVW